MPRPSPTSHGRLAAGTRTIRLGALVLAAALLTSCFTGERPRFDDEQAAVAPTGDSQIDAVLSRLDAVGRNEFTANYDILTRFGGLSSTAVVTQAAGNRRSITVNGEVRYIIDGDAERTCQLDPQTCEASLNDAYLSTAQLTHRFYAPAYAQRLRTEADRRTGETTSFADTIAGQSALCVVVLVGGANEITFCALDSGPLARYVGADLEIEMTSYSPAPDTTLFASS
jgi:hypothetical protein